MVLYFRMKKISIPTKIFKDPQYRGKHLVLVGNKVLAAGSWAKASKVFDNWLKKSKAPPTLTYIPREDALIL